MAVFCRKCGKEIPDDSEFCPHCGKECSPLVNFNEEKEPEVVVQEKKMPKSKHIVAICFLSMFLVACVVLVIAFFPSIKGLFVKEESLDQPNQTSQPTELSPEEVFNKVSPATVEIQIVTHGGEEVLGTGFFINKSGDIVTNYHVIEKAQRGKVYVKNAGPQEIILVKTYDPNLDVAIISIGDMQNDYLVRREEEIAVGMTVYAIGSSLGFSDSFSTGIISSEKRTVDHGVYIQTTAPISPGNSGGPLVDGNGNVIGITSATINGGQNLNLVIPISILDSLSESPMRLSDFGAETDPDYKSLDEIIEDVHKTREQYPFICFTLYDGTKIVHNDLASSPCRKRSSQVGNHKVKESVWCSTLEEALSLGYTPCDVCCK